MKALGFVINCRNQYGFLIPRMAIQAIQQRLEQGRDKGHRDLEDDNVDIHEELRRIGLHLSNIQDSKPPYTDDILGIAARSVKLLSAYNGYRTTNRRD